MPINKIRATLAKLAKKRPVFHSEADFQHALAWELQLDDPTAGIRLEKQVADKTRDKAALEKQLAEKNGKLQQCQSDQEAVKKALGGK